MPGLVFILFNPITLFALLFFAFAVKNVITRHYPSAITYFILSVGITVGGAMIWAKMATSHGEGGQAVISEHSPWPNWSTNVISPNFEAAPLSNVVAFFNQELRRSCTNQPPPSIRLNCTPTRFTKRNVGIELVPAADKLVEEYRQHYPTQEWSLATLENRRIRCDFSYITLRDCIKMLVTVENLRCRCYPMEIVITPPWPEELECRAFAIDERISSRMHLIGSGPIVRPEYSQDLAPSFDGSGGNFPPDGPMRLLPGTNVILSLNRPSWNDMVAKIIQSWNQ